jgi:transcriptional regulator with XRE-family HTH domain
LRVDSRVPKWYEIGMESDHPLKKFRETQEPKLSQKELADLLGVQRETVTRWESGTRQIDIEKLGAVVERTGIAPEILRPDWAKFFKSEVAQ